MSILLEGGRQGDVKSVLLGEIIEQGITGVEVSGGGRSLKGNCGGL